MLTLVARGHQGYKVVWYNAFRYLDLKEGSDGAHLIASVKPFQTLYIKTYMLLILTTEWHNLTQKSTTSYLYRATFSQSKLQWQNLKKKQAI